MIVEHLSLDRVTTLCEWPIPEGTPKWEFVPSACISCLERRRDDYPACTPFRRYNLAEPDPLDSDAP